VLGVFGFLGGNNIYKYLHIQNEIF
jgi:hypothetical protein